LVEDDGTPRFVRLTPELVVGHSGLSADGRFVLAKAQRLAVEHRYAYDEPIPASVLLEELSLLYQQYTMKAAARPLGVSLLVAHLPSSQCTADDDDKNEKPWGLFRLDPSGNVESLRDDEDAVIVMNGSYLERTQLRSRLEDLLKNYRSMTPINEETKGDLEREIAEALRAAIREEQAALLLIDEAPATTGPQPRSGGGVAVAEDRAAPAVIVAALSREVFTVRRYE
jgi:20S proteasome alpha/beta subunit